MEMILNMLVSREFFFPHSSVYVSNEMNIMANLETSYLRLMQFLIRSQKLTFELK